MTQPRVQLRGEERRVVGETLRFAYESGATVRECMELCGKSYGTTHRLLVESGARLRKRREPHA